MRNLIRELRGEQSQDDLAKVIGVSRQTVISLEGGRYNPSLPLAFRIARHFNRPIEEVFLCDDPCPVHTER